MDLRNAIQKRAAEVARPPVPRVSHEERTRNERNYNGDKHVDQCNICGRGLTESAADHGWMYETDNHDRLIHDSERWTSPDSQGSFSIGPECAKKIPAGYKFRQQKQAAKVAVKGHTIRWHGVIQNSRGEAPERIPRTPLMKDKDWGWDATCSCGWDFKTGGAIAQRVRESIQDHLRLDT